MVGPELPAAWRSVSKGGIMQGLRRRDSRTTPGGARPRDLIMGWTRWSGVRGAWNIFGQRRDKTLIF